MIRVLILITICIFFHAEWLKAQESGEITQNPEQSSQHDGEQVGAQNTNSNGNDYDKSEIKIKNNNVQKKIEAVKLNREKNPFMIPNNLYLSIKNKLESQKPAVSGEDRLDESADEKIRWSVRHYNLIAIIWNVKRPKALISDKNKKTHIFYLNERIGNNSGIITAIRNGEVVVKEKLGEIVFRINR